MNFAQPANTAVRTLIYDEISASTGSDLALPITYRDLTMLIKIPCRGLYPALLVLSSSLFLGPQLNSPQRQSTTLKLPTCPVRQSLTMAEKPSTRPVARTGSGTPASGPSSVPAQSTIATVATATNPSAPLVAAEHPEVGQCSTTAILNAEPSLLNGLRADKPFCRTTTEMTPYLAVMRK